jgi:hypothetical protein
MFGGQTYIGYADGSLGYRDAYGRSEGRPPSGRPPLVPSPKLLRILAGAAPGIPSVYRALRPEGRIVAPSENNSIPC